ncbi:helix-turn-helix domain-containing protein [Micromonospora sp. URMC 105]|uniref:helix-turn-helix domain-containing protein n=1 Tax=Micromonospora sp. URMC 105 TaxID=3423413 RepID=UPI003F1B0DA5
MTRSGHHGALYTGPFHAALRTAIRRRGLTLDRLRARLAQRGISIGLSSLSDWQTGRSHPMNPASLRAVRVLEDVLGLPPASLTSLLGDEDGLRHRVVDIGAVAELLDAVPGSRNRDVELINTQHKVVVDADGRPTRLWTRTAVRALRNGVDRYVARYYGGRECEPGLVRPQPLDNCRLGRLLAHPSAPAMVYELVFDQALRTGDTWVFEAELTDPNAGGCSEFAHGFRYPTDQYILEVQFHPGALPATTYAFAQSDLNDERHPLENLALSRHHTVHLIATGVDSGVLGIKWNW